MAAGRPLLFKTPEELEEKINAYFEYCDAGRDITVLNNKGEPIVIKKTIPYTVEGLANWLDCTSETIREYGKRDAFSVLISRAKHKVLQCVIENGLMGQYNPKVVSLVSQNIDRSYNPVQQYEITAQTMEDKLRRLAAGSETPQLLKGDD